MSKSGLSNATYLLPHHQFTLLSWMIPISTQTLCKVPHLKNKTRRRETNKKPYLNCEIPFIHCIIIYLPFMAKLLKNYCLFLIPPPPVFPFFLNPPQSREIALLKVLKDLHIAKSTGYFSVLVWFDIVDHFLFPAILSSLGLQDISNSCFSFCLRICYFSVYWLVIL